MPQTLAFSSSLETLKFSVHNTFETRLLLKIFDAEFPCKLSYFEPLCLPAMMAAETVIRSISLQRSCWSPKLVLFFSIKKIGFT